MPDPTLTRALSAMTAAGLTLADALDPARAEDFLRAPGLSRKTLLRLQEHARGLGVKAPRGGAGRGQGRKSADGATGVVRVTVLLTPEQRAKLSRLGGSAWVRGTIDDVQMAECDGDGSVIDWEIDHYEVI